MRVGRTIRAQLTLSLAQDEIFVKKKFVSKFDHINITVRIAYSVSLTDAEKDVFVPFEFKNEKISFNNNGHHSLELFDLDTIKNIDPFLFLF